MRKIIYCLLVSFLLGTSASHAQGNLEAILTEIEKNNKSLISERQYWETQKLSFKTGLNPDNPRIDYEYMPGKPEEAGTQKDFSVTQGFDFPTSYGKRRSVSNEQIAQSELKFTAFRQEVLLEAKLTYFDYVHHRRLQVEFEKRLQNANLLLESITKKTDQGESNILDLNKIKLLQLEIKNQSAINQTQLQSFYNKLVELNGGLALDLSVASYPEAIPLPAFEALDSLIEANDPVIKTVMQEKEISKKQIELSRSLTFPKIEGGYHQQSILGQKYQGFHVGMTIPLWENKNTVKTQKAQLIYSDYQITEHRTKHYFENKQWYDEYLLWQQTFTEYQRILSTTNNELLLNKALQAGELSLIEYLMEVRYFYDAIVKSLEAERSLQKSVGRLYKFQL
jgi:cobalt-zinc-cadmium efflux system outer membrane protein